MAFWGQSYEKEPLRQNRWFIEFGDNLKDFRYALKECKKPEFEIGVTEHRLLTHTLRYPTNLKWKPVTVKMVSAYSEASSLDKAIQTIISSSGYSLPSSAHQQISKTNSINSLNASNSLTLSQINEEGEVIENWNLKNPFISSVNYGTLTYDNENFVEVSMTIQYDWAEQEDKQKAIKTADQKRQEINQRNVKMIVNPSKSPEVLEAERAKIEEENYIVID